MEHLLFLTFLIVVFALVFDFINGFHDTANSIATTVSTGALKPKTAIILAASMNFLGAILFTGVASFVADKIVYSELLPDNGTIVILAALFAAIFWNLLTWYYGIPSSSSHAILGAIAGASVSAGGLAMLKVDGFLDVVKALLISPVLAFTIGFIIYAIIRLIFGKRNLQSTSKGFRTMQIFTAALQAFSHGTNDAQKAMGIITMALVAAGFQESGSDVQMWVKIACATAMALGTAAGGWKIIKTVGGKIIKIKPQHGVAADLGSSITILVATALHLPVSTTHVISSSIMGVGYSGRKRAVNWTTGKRMVITWVITFPTAFIIAWIFCDILYFIADLF